MRRLFGRSARLREARFVAEGPQAAREAASSPWIEQLYATDSAAERYPEIIDAARAKGARVALLTEDILAAMSNTVTPQGLIVVCRNLDVPLAQVVSSAPRLVAVLSQVRDPGNAGAVIRAADAAGADAVVLTDSSVDVYNPKCVRATAGSLFHLPIVVGAPLSQAISQLREAGLRVLAADGEGEHDLDDLQDQSQATDAASGQAPWLSGPVAWVFGNEAWGLPESDRAIADAVVAVPVHGRAESLNLATAATVCLYATARAHR